MGGGDEITTIPEKDRSCSEFEEIVITIHPSCLENNGTSPVEHVAEILLMLFTTNSILEVHPTVPGALRNVPPLTNPADLKQFEQDKFFQHFFHTEVQRALNTATVALNFKSRHNSIAIRRQVVKLLQYCGSYFNNEAIDYDQEARVGWLLYSHPQYTGYDKIHNLAEHYILKNLDTFDLTEEETNIFKARNNPDRKHPFRFWAAKRNVSNNQRDNSQAFFFCVPRLYRGMGRKIFNRL